MRIPSAARTPLLLGVLLCVLAPTSLRAAAPAVGCPSLANLRILLRQVGDDPAAAAAVLSNEKADHLGCLVVAREAVTAMSEHINLNGRGYDCVTLRTTSVCHWTVAGAVAPVASSPAARKTTEKPAAGAKPETRR